MTTETELSECGCNACYSNPSGRSDQCENGPYWHARADALAKALKGLMEIAEIAMPDTYFASDRRTTAARELLGR